MSTLSNANSVLMLSVKGLYPVPIPVQGFGVDDAFTVGDIAAAETMMGIDGHLSGGYTPVEKLLEITLMADSASNIIFDQLIGAQDIAKDLYVINVTLLVQGTGNLYTFSRGFLKNYTPMAPGRKILQPRKYSIAFESLTQGPG